MFWIQFLHWILFIFVRFTSFVKVVRPLGPFVRAACLCRTIFFVNAVRVSGLFLPSARAIRRPSELSNRTIIINAANPPTNLTTALLCGVPAPPTTMLAHSKQKQTRKQKWNFTTLASGRKRGGRKERGGG